MDERPNRTAPVGDALPRGDDALPTGDRAESSLEVALLQNAPIPIDVDFSCGSGEMLALIGPSGSGKTTILRSIAGLYAPRQGRIRLGNETWFDTAVGTNLPPQRRRVGLVFQDYALFPHLPARANIEIALGHLLPGERRAQADALLGLVNMHGLGDRHPAALSGGQRQRVAVARALARDPAILLLDEPFSAVDRATRRRLQRELTILRRQIAVPTIFVTHDLAEAVNLADRMALLYRGRILQTGCPVDVLARPVSALAARLLDLSNIFEATLLAERTAPARGENGNEEGGKSRGDDDQQGCALIDWRGVKIEVKHATGFAPGCKVNWVIPDSGVVLHRRDRPSRGERENPLTGRVVELVILGDLAHVRFCPDHAPELPLNFSLSAHAARRNGLEPGVAATVSLLSDQIHLMPFDSEAP